MSDMHLAISEGGTKPEMVPNRKGFGQGLLKAGQQDERIVALCADLTESTQISLFAEQFPDRFIEIGVAEQNLVTVGSGMAAMGKIPFVSSYAAFSPGRNWEQIRTTVCLNNRPVKIIGAHAGLYTGKDGATHQMLEDIALMRALPNMVVLAPCDVVEAEKMTLAMAQDERPNYMRLAREAIPVLTTAQTPFAIGKAYVFAPGSDVTIVATGTMTHVALEALKQLHPHGIDAEVIHCPTIKPLDEETLLQSIKKTGRVVTVEEHQINGGLGGAVTELISERHPVPVKRIGVRDQFGQSGTPEELLEHYGLTAKNVAAAVHELMTH